VLSFCWEVPTKPDASACRSQNLLSTGPELVGFKKLPAIRESSRILYSLDGMKNTNNFHSPQCIRQLISSVLSPKPNGERKVIRERNHQNTQTELNHPVRFYVSPYIQDKKATTSVKKITTHPNTHCSTKTGGKRQREGEENQD